MSVVAKKHLLIAGDNLQPAFHIYDSLNRYFGNYIQVFLVRTEEQALKALNGDPFESWTMWESEFVSEGLKAQKVWHAFIVDYQMPHQDVPNPNAGVEIAKAVYEKCPETAKVFAYSFTPQDKKYFDDVIPKDFTVRLLRQMLEYHGLL